MTTKKTTPQGLVGRPFVVWSKSDDYDEMLPNWHGEVVADLGAGYFLLAYYSGMGDGQSEIFHISDMVRHTPERSHGAFQFFDSGEHFNHWQEYSAKYIWERHRESARAKRAAE